MSTKVTKDKGLPLRSLFGLLKKKNGPRLSIQRINEVARQGWSGQGGSKR